MRADHAGRRLTSAAARAEAAAWIARLHSPNRTREVEEGLRRWLEADPEHAPALELLTDVWEHAARLSRARLGSPSPAVRRLKLARAALAAMMIALVPTGVVHHSRTTIVATGVDQLRSVTLADGTRIRLDAHTQLLVRYGRRSRRVTLVNGQAYFQVTHRPDWPFTVTAAGHVIRDLGTQFDVRRDGNVLAVTLVEGKVTVSSAPRGVQPMNRAAAGYSSSAHAAMESSTAQTFSLTPGERVTFDGARSAKIDWPRIAQVTAWEHGEVVLDNTSLGEAAAELNRYSRQRIEIDDPAVAAIRVSGVVQAGASFSFAAAVAKAYQLRALHPSPGVVVLAPAR